MPNDFDVSIMAIPMPMDDADEDQAETEVNDGPEFSPSFLPDVDDMDDNIDDHAFEEQAVASVTAKMEHLVLSAPSSAMETLYSYFDMAQLKNWAGPEHWKMRRPSCMSID
jgi:condensin complex subunit 2